jgi:hypothetical protein
VRVTLELLDVIAKLLAAAKASPDPKVRLVYLAEARVQLEAGRARMTSLDMQVAATEAEFARLGLTP